MLIRCFNEAKNAKISIFLRGIGAYINFLLTKRDIYREEVVIQLLGD